MRASSERQLTCNSIVCRGAHKDWIEDKSLFTCRGGRFAAKMLRLRFKPLVQGIASMFHMVPDIETVELNGERYTPIVVEMR